MTKNYLDHLVRVYTNIFPWVLVKLWFAWTKHENNRISETYDSKDVSQSTPTKEQPRSTSKEESKYNIAKSSSRWSKRIYHCHIRCPESEDIRRREGFGKTGITPSSELRLMRINTFWKRHDDAHTPTKGGPEAPQWETDRPHYRADRSGPAAKRASLLVCSRRFLHRPIKPHLGCRSMSVGSYGGKAPPQDYINRPKPPGSIIFSLAIYREKVRVSFQREIPLVV
jgi:hypothetical protein